MREYIDLLHDGERVMRAYKAVPNSGMGPAVVVLQEIFGVNAAMRAVADDLAENGFVALVPDLFWRIKPGIELGYDPDGMQQALATWKQLDLQQAVADAISTIAAARGLGEATGKVAVLGFCLGGQLAIKAAARQPVEAVVSFYGVRLNESREEIESLSAPTQFHFGDADTHFSPEARQLLADTSAVRPQMELHIYPGAQHGFYNRFRDVSYDDTASALARARFLTLLENVLAKKPLQHAAHDRV